MPGPRKQKPRHAPGFNPIEQVFAKLKTLLRRAAARTSEGVRTCIGRLLESFSPAECASYLHNAGYASI
jgi:transposase